MVHVKKSPNAFEIGVSGIKIGTKHADRQAALQENSTSALMELLWSRVTTALTAS